MPASPRFSITVTAYSRKEPKLAATVPGAGMDPADDALEGDFKWLMPTVDWVCGDETASGEGFAAPTDRTSVQCAIVQQEDARRLEGTRQSCIELELEGIPGMVLD